MRFNSDAYDKLFPRSVAGAVDSAVEIPPTPAPAVDDTVEDSASADESEVAE